MRKILFSLVLLLLAFFGLPIFLETPTARSLIASRIEKKVPGSRVSLKKIEASWTGPFYLEGVKIQIGDSDITIDEVLFSKPLWKLFVDRTFHGDFTGIASTLSGERGSINGTFYVRGDESFSFDLDHFPTAIISSFRSDLGFFKDLLGEYLEGKLEKIGDHFNLDLKSEKSILTVSGKEKEGLIFLKEPLVLKRKITSGDVFDSAAGTLFSSRLASPVDVSITIHPKHFHIDTTSGLESLSIGRGEISFTPFELKAPDMILDSLAMIRKTTDPLLSMEATPLFFSVKQSQIQIERIDFLFDHTYHLALWGDVDFERSRLNLTAGLTDSVIFQSFGIEAKKGTMIQVPIRGTFNEPVVDTSHAVSKLEAMVAKKQNAVVQLLYSLFKKKAPKVKEAPAPSPVVKPSWE